MPDKGYLWDPLLDLASLSRGDVDLYKPLVRIIENPDLHVAFYKNPVDLVYTLRTDLVRIT